MRYFDPIYFAPQRKFGGGWICWKDSPSQPAAPDYTGAAVAQGQANIDAARATAKLSNPNITTPLGTRTVTYGSGTPTFNQTAFDAATKAYYGRQSQPQDLGGGNAYVPTDPNTGQPMAGKAGSGGMTGGTNGAPPNPKDFYTGQGDPDVSNVNIKLAPDQQKLLDQQTRISQGVGDVGEGMLGRVGESVAQPFSLNGLPSTVTNVQQSGPQISDFNKARDDTTNALIARNQPLMDRSRSMLATQLRNQGLVSGGEAYSNAMDDQSRQENDFRLAAVNAGNQEQSQLFQEALAQGNQQFGQGTQNAGLQNAGRATGLQESIYQRQLPLTELNAFRTGAQPQMPQFQSYSPTQVNPAPVFQGAQAQGQYNQGLYNSQVGQQNSMLSGLFGLGGAGLNAYAMLA